MSFTHLLLLGIIAIIVIPPDKLPEVARQVAKFLGEMRRMTSGLFDDLRDDVILKPEDMLKKRQQQENSAQPQSPLVTPMKTPEEIKEAEEEYLKQIQADSINLPLEEKKKSQNE